MKEKKLYTCETCFTDYNDKKKAIECEKTHITPLEIADCRYVPLSNCKTGYPQTIDIKFKDGKTIKYRR